MEKAACVPGALTEGVFNAKVELPYGLTANQISSAMSDFIDFLGFINVQLHERGIVRLESMLMPANFSSIVGEFIITALPKHCPVLAKNQYHNGHPDLIPRGRFPQDSVQHSTEGIEVKSSRYRKGWQGHNPEEIWLMVFIFDCNRPRDLDGNAAPEPFRFLEVLGAQLQREDWVFSGRSATSRRTITASVTNSGYQKMSENWIYRLQESK